MVPYLKLYQQLWLLDTLARQNIRLLCTIAGKMLMLRQKQHGFTIIELLVAIAIFGLTIPALAAAINNLVVLNNRSRDMAVANLIAESKAETLRGAGFNSLSPGTVDFTNELPAELASPKSASYTITNPEAGIAEIVINISYDDYNQVKNRQYKTVVSELGVGQ